MSPYNPLLAGEVNLHNVGFSLLAIAGLGAVVTLLGRALGSRETVPAGQGRAVFAALVPLLAATIGLTLLATVLRLDGVPDWGPLYLLPALFLALAGVLAAYRPVQAATVLAAAAIVAVAAQALLGVTAEHLDPAWVRDGLDRGSLVITTLAFGFPALLTAMLLLNVGTPRTRDPKGRRPPDHHL